MAPKPLFVLQSLASALVALVFYVVATSRAVLVDNVKLRSSLTHRPAELSAGAATLTYVLIIFKKASAWLLQPLGLIPGLKEKADGTFDLPYAEVSAPFGIDEADIKGYRRSIAKKDTKESTSTDKPLFLIPVLLSPLLPVLLSKFPTPILPLGSVNVRNRMEFNDIDKCKSILDGSKQANQFIATASLGGKANPGRRVKRGLEFDVEVVLRTNSDKGTSKPVFKLIFTVLQMLSTRPKSPIQAPAAVTTSNAFRSTSEELRVDFNGPSRWAAVSKDYNPIHMSAFAAKAFGFPGKLAHGNMVAAMGLDRFPSEIESTAFKSLSGKASSSFWLEVAFKRPMVVPAKLEVKWTETGNAFEVTSTRKGETKVHVDGALGLL